MLVNVKKALEEFDGGVREQMKPYLPDITLETDKISAIMINETVPRDPGDDFYGKNDPPYYLTTAIPLFQKAGIQVSTIYEILGRGVYITNAVKIPKPGYDVSKDALAESLPLLEREIGLFPRIKAIMLMGDVAKKAFNAIAKQKTGKYAVPAVSTYKLRHSEIYFGGIRVFPSYIITGGNILIEKSKFEMAAKAIGNMMAFIE
jgi:uracil-DNA glycosylase